MDGSDSVLATTFWVALLVACGAVILSLAGMVSAARRKRLSRLLALTTGALLPAVMLFALLLALLLGIYGYSALTREEVIAVVTTHPTGEQAFLARIEFPGGEAKQFRLQGDELYVDARVLKWKYWAHLLGVHTAYELDRIAGRYRSLSEERTRPRTLYSLSPERPVDLFELRRRFPQLSPLFDAEYGSATFVPAEKRATYEIRLSTTGLLARRVTPSDAF